jgi:hypothetical protein
MMKNLNKSYKTLKIKFDQKKTAVLRESIVNNSFIKAIRPKKAFKN